MAVTLIATSGATNANSYITLADAETYFETRLHKSSWDDETDDNKTIALIWATRLLDDYFIWDGFKVSTGQALMWPRSNIFDIEGNSVSSGSIPTFLANATAEYAMFLLDEDKSIEDGTKGFSRITLSGLDIYIDKNDRKGVIPQSVYAMVRNYGEVSYYKRRILVRG